MTKGDLEKLTKFVKVVMSYKPDRKGKPDPDINDKITERKMTVAKKPTEETPEKPHNYDKFTWQEGDLTIVKRAEKSVKKPVKKDKK